MGEVRNIIIGVQARSTSERFPRKVFEIIERKPMIQHVLDAAYNSMNYLNRYGGKNQMLTQVVMVIPTGDELGSHFRNKVTIFSGPEHDVLTRYHMMAVHYKADYIVRITGDCPLIPGNLISKHVQTALHENYDYLSNVEDDFRTAPDGMDCEVLSRRALDWLNETALELKDREHVTSLIRDQTKRPEWARVGHVVGFIDLAQMKLSVDTPEDLERVRYEFHRVKRILELAEKLHGKKGVHRF